MQIGGNERFNKFMLEQNVPADMPIREKYRTKAAKWYREALRAEAEGLPLPEPLEPGEGPLPEESVQSPEGQLLDEIFARVPHQSTMTAGGVPLGSRKNLQTKPHEFSRGSRTSMSWHASWAAKSLAFLILGSNGRSAEAVASADGGQATRLSKPCTEASRGYAARHLAAAH